MWLLRGAIMEIFQNVLILQIETSFAYIICRFWVNLLIFTEIGLSLGVPPTTVLIVAYIFWTFILRVKVSLDLNFY